MTEVTVWLMCLLLAGAYGADLPCAPREGDPGQGKICVCNSTYCDTIERPSKLPSGQYHLYSTSNSTPGFTHTIGTFQYAASPSGDEDIVFTINSSVKYQDIRGIGGSFTDSFGMVMETLPTGAQDKLMESYFGPTGIEYTFCRTVVGSSDFSPRFYTYDDVPGDVNLEHFSLAEEDYKYKIPYMKKAKAVSLRGIEIYGCPWNGPLWMKTKNGNSSDLSGYLSFKYFKSFAEYFVKFIQAYKDNGIDIWAVSQGNEPLLSLFFGVNLNLTINLAHDQKVWARDYLVPSLKAANLSEVKFMALDDMRMYAIYWMQRFADDPKSYDAVDSIGLHWYLDFYVPPFMLDIFHYKFPEKKIYYTETSINGAFFPGTKAVILGSWTRAALYMYNVMENINHWTSGYIDWNLALNTKGGPSMSMALEAAVIVNETSKEFYKQPIFYGLGHFSKFIPPGSRRVFVKSNQNLTLHMRQDGGGYGPHVHPPTTPSTVVCVATASPDGNNTVIVMNNMNVTARVRLEVPEIGSITLDLEEYSINSFIYALE